MSAQTNPDDPLIRVRRDRAARVRYGTTDESSRAVERFAQVQRALLSQPTLSLGASIAGRLIAVELILDDAELRAILRTLPSGVYLGGVGQLCLEWRWGAGWLDRRMVSPLTGLALESHQGPLGEAVVLGELISWIRHVVPRWDDGDDGQVLARLLAAGRAWSVLRLPGFLAAHVCRDAPLCALPRSALARASTRLALIDPQQIDSTRRADPRLLGSLLDAVSSGAGSGGDQSPHIKALNRAIRAAARIGGTHHRMRQAMLESIEPLLDTATRAGWQAALLFAWVFDFIESGTARVTDLSVNTILGYVPPLLEPLMLELEQLDTLPRDASTWSALYERVLASRTSGARKNAASALASFHRHLRTWHEVEPLDAALHAELIEPPPAANTVWPHELERALDWLRQARFDPRLPETLSVAFRLAWSCRLRTSELLTLRLHNVGSGTIEVAPMIRDRAPKSDSGHRTMRLDAGTTEVLASWVRQRRAEGAQEDALLFGDPHNPEQIYRQGLLHYLLITLLRAATGDASITFHSLSHAWCCRQLVERPHPLGDIDWLNQVAAGMGHFSAASLRPYANHYESWLRLEIDHVLELTVELRAADAAWLLGEPAPRLRKRLQRLRDEDSSASVWRLLDSWQANVHWPVIEAGIPMAGPVRPAWLDAPAPLSVEHIGWILEDLASDQAPDELTDWVCRRTGCTPVELERVVHAFMQLLRLIGAWVPQRRVWTARDQAGYFLLSFAGWSRSGTRIDFRRRHSHKFASIRAGLPHSTSDPVWVAWAECFHRRGYLALRPVDAAQLFAWLQRCGVPGVSLGISAESGSTPKNVLAIKGAFRTAFGERCAAFSHIPSQGRPAIYLLWSSRDITETAPAPAAVSLDGLHAWMLAAGVAAVLREDTRDIGGLLMPQTRWRATRCARMGFRTDSTQVNPYRHAAARSRRRPDIVENVPEAVADGTQTRPAKNR